VAVAGTADVVAVATGVDTAASDDDGLAVGATEGGTFTTETFEDCGVPLSPNTTNSSPSGLLITDFASPFRSTGRFSVGVVVGHGTEGSGQTWSTVVVVIWNSPLLSWLIQATLWSTMTGVAAGPEPSGPTAVSALGPPGRDDDAVVTPPCWDSWEEVSVPMTTATTSAALRRA